MAKEFSQSFYNSREWRKARESYWRMCGGLCDECRKNGVITPAVIVHHRTPLSPENINDAWTRTSPENLQALCRYHHEQVHSKNPRRYTVREDGSIVVH